MDQHTLRELEKRCVQEEPPPCTAACPLHVDVRAFVGRVQEGQWGPAFQVLSRTMPLPGVLGRVCDAPCRLACSRKDAGGAVRIHELERACVRRSDGKRRVMPLPKKEIRVAVAGGGLSSLTVAWDLVRKGYGVSALIPEDSVGDWLLDQYPKQLTREIIAKETDLLARLGVCFETAFQPGLAGPDRLLETHAAVYVGLDAVSGPPWGVDSTKDPRGGTVAGITGRKGLFAGGDHRSPVWQAARGRWAATSMDRWLQNVSMIAGREREGPVSTRLSASRQGAVSLPPVAMADPSRGLSETEALAEAGRCLQCQCLECVKVCVFLERFGSYPKKIAREIYNNESIVMGERKANRLINSCSLCGLCEAVCPNGFAVQDLCLTARQSMVARGRMPPSAHEFALRDMAFSQGERFAMARHEPGRTASQYLFFPGCQLCASSPEQVRRVYDHLRHRLSGGVALMLDCCGAPAHWAGRQEMFAAGLAAWKQRWSGLGRPEPIMACATCLRMFTDHLPEAGAVSLWELLETAGLPEAGRCLPKIPLAVHDPCTTRNEPGVQDAVRRLLARMEVAVEELDPGREKTECCGFGGLMQNANPALAREVAERRGGRSQRDFLAYCAMCRDNFAAAGKRTVHLLDLLFPDPDDPDPAGRPRPGWSQRRENRTRLKADLCRELWGERPAAGAEHQKIVLRIDPDVNAVLESRRILIEDLQKVIRHAENGGPRFCHPDTGHILATFRPCHATFWVEYSPVSGGFMVHNAYAHRMEVLGP